MIVKYAKINMDHVMGIVNSSEIALTTIVVAKTGWFQLLKEWGLTTFCSYTAL